MKLTSASIVEDDLDKLKELKTKNLFSSSKMKPCMFAVVTESHALFLSADTEEDKTDWIQSIRSAITELTNQGTDQAPALNDELHPLDTPPMAAAPTPPLRQYSPFGISTMETSPFQKNINGQPPPRQNFTPPPLIQKKKFFPDESDNAACQNQNGYNRYCTAPQQGSFNQTEQNERRPQMPATRPPNAPSTLSQSTLPPSPAIHTPERESQGHSEELSANSLPHATSSPLKNSQFSIDGLPSHLDVQQPQMTTVPPKKPERLQNAQQPLQNKPVKPAKPVKPLKPIPSPSPPQQQATPSQSSTTAVTSNSPYTPTVLDETTDLDELGVTF